jgi:hypothetical protein
MYHWKSWSMTSSSTWRKNIKKLSKKPFAETDVASIFADITRGKNDRGSAIAAAALVECMLQETIELHLAKTISNEDRENLFAADGIISTFSAKIRVAYAFNIIDSNLMAELDKIREIRNVFAHALTAVRFKDPAIQIACSLLEIPNENISGRKISRANPQRRYFSACINHIYLMYLCGSIRALMCYKARVPPIGLKDWPLVQIEIDNNAASKQK